jgi:hypothetical protein
VLLQDFSLDEGEMLVTLIVILLLLLLLHSLVEHLLLVVVVGELVFEGGSALLLVVLLLSDLVSYTVQELLVSSNLVSTVNLTILNVVAHLAEMLLKNVVIVLSLSENHFLSELDSLEHLFGLFG